MKTMLKILLWTLAAVGAIGLIAVGALGFYAYSLYQRYAVDYTCTHYLAALDGPQDEGLNADLFAMGAYMSSYAFVRAEAMPQGEFALTDTQTVVRLANEFTSLCRAVPALKLSDVLTPEITEAPTETGQITRINARLDELMSTVSYTTDITTTRIARMLAEEYRKIEEMSDVISSTAIPQPAPAQGAPVTGRE